MPGNRLSEVTVIDVPEVDDDVHKSSGNFEEASQWEKI